MLHLCKNNIKTNKPIKKTNFNIFAKNKTSIGIGAGQMSRIDAAKLASKKAIEKIEKLGGKIIIAKE